ncbi:MAG: leucine-rich repeat protein [Bacteroidales bacterium]|nr:leucine-rich repeat protein [Bacteroidales bacterium]
MKHLRKLSATLCALLSVFVPLFVNSSCTEFDERFEDIRNQLDTLVDQNITPLARQVEMMDVSVEDAEQTRQALEAYIDELAVALEELSEREKELEARIEELSAEMSGEISSMESDIRAQIEAQKKEMETAISDINALLTKLRESDAALGNRIDQLKEYTDNALSEAENWTSGTYATLEQYNSTVAVMSSVQQTVVTLQNLVSSVLSRFNTAVNTLIPASLAAAESQLRDDIKKLGEDMESAVKAFSSKVEGEYKKALESALETSRAGMESWVNNQLTGYSNITDVEQMISLSNLRFNATLNAQKAYLVSAVDSLSSHLDSLVKANNRNLDDLAKRLDEVDAFEKALPQTLIDLAAQIDADAAAIEANAARIFVVDSLIRDVSPEVKTLETLADAQIGRVEEMRDSLGVLSRYEYAKWLAESLASIVENSEDIAEASSLIARNAEALAANVKAIWSNTENLDDFRDSVDLRKEKLRQEYNAAIQAAIEEAEGRIKEEIRSRLILVNASLDDFNVSFVERRDTVAARVGRAEAAVKSLNERFASIQQRIVNARSEIDKLLSRIQSMSRLPVPGCKGAAVTYTTGRFHTASASLRFKVLPSGTAEGLAAHPELISAAYLNTLTRAGREIPASLRSVSADGDILSVIVDATVLPRTFFTLETGASVSIIVSDGNNSFQTDYCSLECIEVDGELSVPDSAFREYLLANCDMNSDGLLTLRDSVLFDAANEPGAGFDLSGTAVSSLEGLCYFPDVSSIDITSSLAESISLGSNVVKELFMDAASIGRLSSDLVLPSVTIRNGNGEDLLLKASFDAVRVDFRGSATGILYIPEECRLQILLLDNDSFFCRRAPSDCDDLEALAARKVEFADSVQQKKFKEVVETQYSDGESWDGCYGGFHTVTDVNPMTYVPLEAISDLSLLQYFKSLETIPSDWQFSNGSLANLLLPPSVKTIGDCAFYGCPLTSLDIPSSVESIGSRAFASEDSNMELIRFRSAVPPAIADDSFSYASVGRIIVPQGSRAAYSALLPAYESVIEEEAYMTVNTSDL